MGLTSTVIGMLFAGIPEDALVAYALGFVLGCLLAAFFSFRFFKLTIVLYGLAIGYSFGYASLGMLLGDRITSFNAPLVLGIACALVFGILAPKFYKAMIYFIGGVIGYAIGFVLAAGLLSAFGYEGVSGIVGFVAGVFVAVFFAKLVYRFFKVYIIISSAFAGSILAAIVVSSLLFGDSGLALTVFSILGIILGIVATRAQFKMNRGRDLDL